MYEIWSLGCKPFEECTHQEVIISGMCINTESELLYTSSQSLSKDHQAGGEQPSPPSSAGLPQKTVPPHDPVLVGRIYAVFRS